MKEGIHMQSRKQKLMAFLKQILSDKTITDQERSLYEKCFTDLNQNEDINKCIYHLKKDLSILSVNHQFSSNGLNYFTELSRIEPSTSVSSMWNFLVRKGHRVVLFIISLEKSTKLKQLF